LNITTVLPGGKGRAGAKNLIIFLDCHLQFELTRLMMNKTEISKELNKSIKAI